MESYLASCSQKEGFWRKVWEHCSLSHLLTRGSEGRVLLQLERYEAISRGHRQPLLPGNMGANAVPHWFPALSLHFHIPLSGMSPLRETCPGSGSPHSHPGSPQRGKAIRLIPFREPSEAAPPPRRHNHGINDGTGKQVLWLLWPLRAILHGFGPEERPSSWERWKEHWELQSCFLASPRARCPFPRAGSPAGGLAGGSSLKGLIRPRMEKQSQAPKDRGQVKHVRSLEGYRTLRQAFTECLLYAKPWDIKLKEMET